MNNPFQQQLLKAGLVNKKQVKKANQDKSRKRKQQKNTKNDVVDETSLNIQRAAEEKNKRDRDLNRQKDQQARSRAISLEIDQLIKSNRLTRGDNCEIAYNFDHRKKVNRIYVDEVMKQQIIQGKLGIARIEGSYELVPADVAEKIRSRNEKRIILFKEEQSSTQDDEYADYQIPDDLTW